MSDLDAKGNPLSPSDSPRGSHSSGIFSDHEVLSEYEDELEMGEGDIANYGYLLPDEEGEDVGDDVEESTEGGSGDNVKAKLQEIRNKVSKSVTLQPEIFKNSGLRPPRGASKKVIAMYQ
jgi:hypothetical protein